MGVGGGRLVFPTTQSGPVQHRNFALKERGAHRIQEVPGTASVNGRRTTTPPNHPLNVRTSDPSRAVTTLRNRTGPAAGASDP